MAKRYGQVAITGDKELLEVLKRLPKHISDKILDKAIRKGANILKKEASLRAPSRKGNNVLRRYGKGLKREIIVRKLAKRKARGETILQVGPSRDAFYGIFVEFGTVHRYHKSGKSVGAITQDNAQPFMRPAFDAKVDEIQSEATKILRDEVMRAAGRLAR